MAGGYVAMFWVLYSEDAILHAGPRPMLTVCLTLKLGKDQEKITNPSSGISLGLTRSSSSSCFPTNPFAPTMPDPPAL